MRKQAIADYVITISGIRNEDLSCGMINIVKSRRGRLGYVPYQLNKSGRMQEINKDRYKQIVSEIRGDNSGND